MPADPPFCVCALLLVFLRAPPLGFSRASPLAPRPPPGIPEPRFFAARACLHRRAAVAPRAGPRLPFDAGEGEPRALPGGDDQVRLSQERGARQAVSAVVGRGCSTRGGCDGPETLLCPPPFTHPPLPNPDSLRYALLEADLRELSLHRVCAPGGIAVHMVSSRTTAGIAELRRALTREMPAGWLRFPSGEAGDAETGAAEDPAAGDGTGAGATGRRQARRLPLAKATAEAAGAEGAQGVAERRGGQELRDGRARAGGRDPSGAERRGAALREPRRRGGAPTASAGGRSHGVGAPDAGATGGRSHGVGAPDAGATGGWGDDWLADVPIGRAERRRRAKERDERSHRQQPVVASFETWTRRRKHQSSQDALTRGKSKRRARFGV
eukprot:scaffold16587_cov141-Isochrysis_galbana.AAC.5